MPEIVLLVPLTDMTWLLPLTLPLKDIYKYMYIFVSVSTVVTKSVSVCVFGTF